MSGPTRTQRAHRARVEALLADKAGIWTDASIGRHLGLSPRTIENWRCRLRFRRTSRWGWYTTGQVARLTGLSEVTVRRMIHRGQLRARRLVAGNGYRRGWWMVAAEDAERLLRERRPEVWEGWRWSH